jgi:hypothetical protein
LSWSAQTPDKGPLQQVRVFQNHFSSDLLKNLQRCPGLPDGSFSNQKLGKIWRVLQRKMLVYFMDTSCAILWAFVTYILWTFGTVRDILVYFFPFWYFVPRKIWQPWRRHLLGE